VGGKRVEAILKMKDVQQKTESCFAKESTSMKDVGTTVDTTTIPF
jgi:hypothetical protein